MHRLLIPMILLLTLPFPSFAALARWDALPALDVMHLAGPLAGTTTCPMCRHGYDAGLLVLVPATTSVQQARAAAERLEAVTRRIDDQRFRGFLVVTGSPTPALIEALARSAPDWHVARLERTPADAPGLVAHGEAAGYVFAQRRMLFAFDPRDAHVDVLGPARHAMQFLAATYDEPAGDSHPDTPKGRLWLAPARLTDHARFGSGADPGVRRACLVAKTGARLAQSLMALRTVPGVPVKPSPWVRTDDQGCLALTSLPTDYELHAEVFTDSEPPFPAILDGDPRDAGSGLPLFRSASFARAGGGERVVGQCEDCADIAAMPRPSLAAQARMADASEPGERLVVSGTVRDRAGHPQSGIVLFAYQTDASGRYHPDPHVRGLPSSHARLRAWVRTDAAGNYRLDTIRPGLYPDRSLPAHIHLHVIEPGRCTYFTGDILFDDDPTLTRALRKESRTAPGGSGLVEPVRAADGSWTALRDIILGLNVNGYEACGSSSAS